jgi:hypothetical protein
MLRHEQIDEQVDPASERGVRRGLADEAGLAGLGAGLDLVSVHGDDQVRSCRTAVPPPVTGPQAATRGRTHELIAAEPQMRRAC